MATVTILRRPKTTITHPASVTHQHVALNPELVEELRKRVEKPAHTSLLSLAKALGLRLWQYLKDLNDWAGGAPMTGLERERMERLDIHANNSRYMVM